MSETAWQQDVPDEGAVAELAAVFAEKLETPTVIYLEGDLGAGKTTFARAYVHALGFKGYVKSPSYGLLETYAMDGQTVLHLDLYRIEDPEELEYLALRDLYDDQATLLVEWPGRGQGFLPEADLLLKFDENSRCRTIECRVFTKRGSQLAEKVKLSS